MKKANAVETASSQRRLILPLVAALALGGAPASGGTSLGTGTKAAGTKAADTKAAGTKAKVSGPSKPKAMPTFEAVKASVTGQLKKNRYYKSGDVLSRKEIDPIFGKLATLGWKVDDRKAILEQLLPDDYYLIKALRSPDNSLFMRQVGQVRDGYGYDRLDRISRMADGQILVSRIMQEPGGWNFIDIMSETKEARGMAQAFSMGPGGKDFTKPTGRIYTEPQLVARLKESYDKAKNKPATKEPPKKEAAKKEPATKEPATKEPATKEPATKEPATKEPATKMPATKKPGVKQPSAKKL